MRVRWSLAANQHLAGIVDFIAFENPHAALRFDDLLRRAVDRLADFPQSGRPGLIAGTRELLPHRSYRIVYDIEGETVRIMAIVHTSRQWPPAEDDA